MASNQPIQVIHSLSSVRGLFYKNELWHCDACNFGNKRYGEMQIPEYESLDKAIEHAVKNQFIVR